MAPLKITPLALGWITPLLHLLAAAGFVGAWMSSRGGSTDETTSNVIFGAAITLAILARVVKWRLARELTVSGDTLAIERDGITLSKPFRLERGLMASPRGDAHDASVATMGWLRIHGSGAKTIELRTFLRAGAPRGADWPVAAMQSPRPELLVYMAPDADLVALDAALSSG